MASYEKSATKQSLRDFIFNTFAGKPPKVQGRPYHIMTLPGTPGYEEPRSLEKMLRKQYPNAVIEGLEHSNNAATRVRSWLAVNRLHHEHPGLLNKLRYLDIGNYFLYCNVLRPMDLVFEDRCGGATANVVTNGWGLLFKKKNLSNGAYVAITLCESPRIRHLVHSTEVAFDHIVKLCERQKMNLELLKFLRYDNGSLSAYTPGYSQPMVFLMMRVTY